MKKIITFLMFYLSISVFPQTYNDFAQEIFFGRLASTKTEAMGRILALNFDSYFVSQSNPANLAATKGIAGFYSHSSPLYGYNEATYNYAGVSYNNATVGAFAFNFLSFKTGMTFYVTEEGCPEIIGTFEPGMDLYTLTYSNEIAQWFSFGINANLFINHLGEDQSFTGTFFELGLSRDFHLISDSQIKDDISIGTQLKNIFNQSFSAIDEAQADAFPSIFRVGISNTTEYTDTDAYKNSYLLGFTLGIEYQDLFNSNSRTAYKVGGELSVIDILFLRGGYFYETKINYNINYTSKLREFTYGAGLKLDFDQLFKNDFPLVLLFDFVSLEQPSYGQAPIDWDNFTAFTLIANYKLNL